mgnify:FL=1
MASDSLLLDGGSNEVEILEFLLARQGYGVNVLKIQAIEEYDDSRVTALPMAPFGVAGTLLFRNRSIPLLDLAAILGVESTAAAEEAANGPAAKRVVLVTEFNNVVSAILVDGVNRIHRVSWEEIKPLSSAISDCATEFTGSVDIQNHEVLVLDLEKIIAEVIPGARIADLKETPESTARHAARADVQIILAEDSKVIRSRIASVLKNGGYVNLRPFENGRDAFDAISQLKTQAEQDGVDVAKRVSLIITDIEMPQINGLTLCKSVKKSLGMGHVPVLVFSSLTGQHTLDECKAAGADGCITKPDIESLVERIDAMCLDGVSEQAA